MKTVKANYGLLIGLTTVMWVVITVLAWIGLWYWGILVSFLMILLYLVAGGAKNGKLGRRFLAFPIVPWFVSWIVCFVLAQYFAAKFDGIAPDYTILGFHPSFTWIFVAWVLSVVILAGGFFINRDLWLTGEEWDDFRKKIKELNEVK